MTIDRKVPAKRVDIITTQIVKEGSRLYADRRISSPNQVLEITREFIEGSDREKFIVIYMNVKNEPIAIHTVGIGTLVSCQIEFPAIYRAGILCASHSMIFVHCHPSGDPYRSQSDIDLTNKAKKVSEIIGIPILDHVIVSSFGDKYYSFKEEGLI